MADAVVTVKGVDAETVKAALNVFLSLGSHEPGESATTDADGAVVVAIPHPLGSQSAQPREVQKPAPAAAQAVDASDESARLLAKVKSYHSEVLRLNGEVSDKRERINSLDTNLQSTLRSLKSFDTQQRQLFEDFVVLRNK